MFFKFSYVEGFPPLAGRLRTCAEDFQVDEELNFLPTGEGEHVLLQIRKRHTNTEWLAQQLAKLSGVKLVDVSYAGLKDRHALTTQWFSVRLAGRPEPAWQHLASPDIEFLHMVRHSRKLRRGALRANHFKILIRDVQGDRKELEHRLQRVACQGVPNYFGEQRFGNDYNNLTQAEALLTGTLKVRDRHKRSLYLSAARSLLFNAVLSARVDQALWNQAIHGDVMQFENSSALFLSETVTPDIIERLSRFDIHPTGPLWGRGTPMTQGQTAKLESEVLSSYTPWCTGLEHAGLVQERRALRLKVNQLVWEFIDPHTVHLGFWLPPGGYATTVLRELFHAL